jgi:NitT/TauT family transport system substrate-binding protein
MNRKVYLYTITSVLVLILILAACSTTGTTPKESIENTLTIAVLPILDALPLYVAEEEGLFAEQGVNVEFIPVASAPERDQIILAEQADGMINETLSTILFNKADTQIQIVRLARAATKEAPVFHIIAAGSSGITTVKELKGVEIGISDGTVIEYLTDRLLQAEGFAPEEIGKISVPKIPDRLALLNSGELEAAMLPDPASFVAIGNGAVNVLDDSSHPEYGYSTIAFRKAVLDSQPEAVRAFLAALEKAVELINEDPGRWNKLLSEKQIVPDPVSGSYQINPYPTGSVPTEQQYQDVLLWAQSKGLIDNDVPYSQSINPAYLP